MLPMKPKRQRIDFTQKSRMIFFFMSEGEETANFILSHLSKSSDPDLFMRALKRLDNMNVRGAQLQAWYIAMVNHTPSKVPDKVLTAFMRLNLTEQKQLVEAINEDMPRNYPHKAKLYLNIAK